MQTTTTTTTTTHLHGSRSTEELRQAFLANFEAAEDAIHTRYLELDAKRADLQRLKAEFEANFIGNQNDQLALNCGGVEMNVQRGSMTHFKRTGLAALFCGRYDNDMDRDSKGRVFLDLDPNAFNSLVEYLNALRDGRAKVNHTPLMAPIDQHANIDALIDHFKLRPYLTGVVSDNDQVRMQRRRTIMGASDTPSIDEIRQRSDTLRPLIDQFEKLVQNLFEEERRIQKWEEEEDWENIYEFDRYFAELYKRRDTDPIEYVNSLDVQFMCKRSTMKLSEFLYNLQRNRRGEVILTNPGSIVNKILEYLRRRKIRLDDNHVGDLYVEETEWQFFHDTVRSFGILNDLQLRADLKRFTKGAKPVPMRLALPSSANFGHVVHNTTTTTTTTHRPSSPPHVSSHERVPSHQSSQQGGSSARPVVHQLVYEPRPTYRPLAMTMQRPTQPERPEGWTAAQWSAYQSNNQESYMKWYQEQQAKQYAGMTPQEAWHKFYASQAKLNQSASH